MRILGAAAAGDSVCLVVLDVEGEKWSLVDTSATRRLFLRNHEDSASLREFRDAFDAFMNSHGIQGVIIRRASYKGLHRSGAAAIKIEALLQLSNHSVSLAPAQSITKNLAARTDEFPMSLTAYQSDAFATALFILKK